MGFRRTWRLLIVVGARAGRHHPAIRSLRGPLESPVHGNAVDVIYVGV